VTGSDDPIDFIDARLELDAPDHDERTIERVDPSWVTSVAMIPESQLGAIAGRWIELVEDEIGELPREEKPWIRKLAGDIVAFARAADRSPDVVFAWSL
jgi:hypothetical protein